MSKYQLCLFYSSFKYEPLLEHTFTSFHDIDNYTSQFYDEEELRNSNIDKISTKINFYINDNYHYISAIPSEENRLGKIVILNMDSMEYIKPLYQNTQKNASPKKLINDISKKLKDSNSINLLNSFLHHFNKTFNTQYNFIHHKLRFHINNLNYLNAQIPITEQQQQSYNKILSIIKETIKMGYNKDEDSIAEERNYKLRLMNNYLDFKLGLDIKKVNSKPQGKSIKEKKKQEKYKDGQLAFSITRDKSIQDENLLNDRKKPQPKELSSPNLEDICPNSNNQPPVFKTQSEMKDTFIKEVVEKAIAEGREAALLDFMEQYNREICETYFNNSSPSNTKR